MQTELLCIERQYKIMLSMPAPWMIDMTVQPLLRISQQKVAQEKKNRLDQNV